MFFLEFFISPERSSVTCGHLQRLEICKHSAVVLAAYSLFLSFKLIHMVPDSTLSLSTSTTTTPKPINRTKQIVLCEMSEVANRLHSPCDLSSMNFTFYAFFRPKRSASFQNFKHLISMLSESAKCEINYMKVNTVFSFEVRFLLGLDSDIFVQVQFFHRKSGIFWRGRRVLLVRRKASE